MQTNSINSEQLISLAQAARLLPCRREGRPTNPATLYRWAQKGLKGVRLEVVQTGGTLLAKASATDGQPSVSFESGAKPEGEAPPSAHCSFCKTSRPN